MAAYTITWTDGRSETVEIAPQLGVAIDLALELGADIGPEATESPDLPHGSLIRTFALDSQLRESACRELTRAERVLIGRIAATLPGSIAPIMAALGVRT